MILKVEKILQNEMKRMVKRKEDDNIDDDVVAMSDRERRSKTRHNLVKNFSISKFLVELCIDNPTNLTGDLL